MEKKKNYCNSLLIFLIGSFLFAVPACKKNSSGEKRPPGTNKDYSLIDFNNPHEVAAKIGKNYNINHSNLFGIPEKYLQNSDELFGIAPIDNSNKTGVNSFITAPNETPDADFLTSEPKSSVTSPAIAGSSTATYYNSYSHLQTDPAHKMVYNWDVLIYIENDGGLASPADNDKKVFWALQTSFGNGQGAHAGIIWSNGIKKVNFGGYWNGVAQEPVSQKEYNWTVRTPYRIRVWRLGYDWTGYKVQWGAWIKVMPDGNETFIGSFYSTAEHITWQSTWVETIRNGTIPLSDRNIQSVFSYMVYRTADDGGVAPTFEPYHAIANYNDSQTPPPSPTQDKNVSYTFDNIWWGVRTKTIRHRFNTIRTVPAGTYLW